MSRTIDVYIHKGRAVVRKRGKGRTKDSDMGSVTMSQPKAMPDKTKPPTASTPPTGDKKMFRLAMRNGASVRDAVTVATYGNKDAWSPEARQAAAEARKASSAHAKAQHAVTQHKVGSPGHQKAVAHAQTTEAARYQAHKNFANVGGARAHAALRKMGAHH